MSKDGLCIGTFVMAARGARDEDVGKVVTVSGTSATVAWSGGVATIANVVDLEPISASEYLEWLG
jgi:hypothetical protein